MDPNAHRPLRLSLLATAALCLVIVVGLVCVIVATTTPSVAGSEDRRVAARPVAAKADPPPTHPEHTVRPPGPSASAGPVIDPAPAPDTTPDPGRSAAQCPAGRVVLTFDDGPSPSVTLDLIALLTEKRVPATFFMVGSRVAQYPEVARAVAEAGFTIGNHSYNHENLSTLSRKEIRSTLRRTREALHEAGVHRISEFVRPPYGATNDRVRTVLRNSGKVLALWNVDSRDWDDRTAAQIRDSVLEQVRARGRTTSVVLHHDGVANSPATLAALPGEIRTLRSEGYCFVPLTSDAVG